MKVALINHGCAKNLIDSELLLGMLTDKGHSITLDENEAQIVIVNTCAFIHDAEEESVQSILRCCAEGKKVIVAGCLPQKHKKDLQKAIPEVSAFLGISDLEKIVSVVDKLSKSDETIYEISDKPFYKYPETTHRAQITVGASSYLKIAEGCHFKCGYCIIPKLRGDYVSRELKNIIAEANELVAKGVNEIVLIAQDTTSWGIDIYGKPSLPMLLKELDKIENLEWIRLMYTYPSLVDDELLEVIANSKKIVHYIDMPLQHSHPEVLKRMKRPVMDYEKLVNNIRKHIPDVVLRTTFITGYPAETEEEFEHLLNFVKKMKFDKLGVFEFCSEKGTYAYTLKNKIKASVKKQRRNKILEAQQKISLEINRSLIGKEIPVIIEGVVESENKAIARSFRDAPEVDGLVYINTDKELIPSDIVNVRITNANEYDLFAEY